METSHDDMRLLTHPLDGLAQLGPQVRQVKAAEVAQFHSLEVRPQSLSRVEVGSIAGKPFEVDALGSSVRGSNKTYPELVSSSCSSRKQITLAARVSQASWMMASRS